MTIEEAKNADAEDDTTTFSPKGTGGRIVKLNNNLSGEAPKDLKRESNGLGGLIKKVRGGSLGLDEQNNSLKMDSLYAGYKKQTPISTDRNSQENRSFISGANKHNNRADGGTITPLGNFPLGSPNGGGRSKPSIANSKWTNMLNN